MKKLLLIAFVLLFSVAAQADTPPDPQQPAPQTSSQPTSQSVVAPIETTASQVILIDAATGDVLMAKNADERMATSSMIKVLTMYLTFEALRSGKLHLDDLVTVSENAWKQEGSRMFLNVGEKVRVEDLIRGVIIQSGNDAAVALAEALGGSEGNFAAMMNTKAQELGMTQSHFMNAPGLPDPDHYSTARDLARLALATIRDFPEYYHYFSEIEFTHNNIKQGNRNPLLYRGIGVDGLKTGHTEVAGFGLMASSLRDGRRMVLVINGLHSMQERADEPAKILDWGYREFGLYDLLKKDQKVADAKIWLGTTPSVPLVAAKNVVLSLPRGLRSSLKVAYDYVQPVEAPIARGQTLGKIVVSAAGMNDIEVPLVSGQSVARLGFFGRVAAKLRLLFGHGS
jgi:D-alanyl-D-alanine carboxypeptidase (penicillin-binding protein 5/6)